MRLNLNASDRRVFSLLELGDTEDRPEVTKVKKEKTQSGQGVVIVKIVVFPDDRVQCSFSVTI